MKVPYAESFSVNPLNKATTTMPKPNPRDRIQHGTSCATNLQLDWKLVFCWKTGALAFDRWIFNLDSVYNSVLMTKTHLLLNWTFARKYIRVILTYRVPVSNSTSQNVCMPYDGLGQHLSKRILRAPSLSSSQTADKMLPDSHHQPHSMQPQTHETCN